MIVGANRAVTHAGREYHIQVEDLGGEAAAFDVRVYDQGTVLWRKRVSYADVVARGLSRTETEAVLRARLEKMLLTVAAAIGQGRLA